LAISLAGYPPGWLVWLAGSKYLFLSKDAMCNKTPYDLVHFAPKGQMKLILIPTLLEITNGERVFSSQVEGSFAACRILGTTQLGSNMICGTSLLVIGWYKP
jgi:hypothetical protein